MRVFLDTYALIEIANGNPSLQKYLTADAITLRENLAELYYAFLRTNREDQGTYFFTLFSKIAVEIPIPIIQEAMRFRYIHKKKDFSYIDCFGYTFALKEKRLFVTGDQGFYQYPSVDFIS